MLASMTTVRLALVLAATVLVEGLAVSARQAALASSWAKVGWYECTQIHSITKHTID